MCVDIALLNNSCQRSIENDRIDIESTSLYGNHTSRQSKKETCQTYTTKVKNASHILPMSAIHIANNTIDQNEI